jgi:hypothetical protein
MRTPQGWDTNKKLRHLQIFREDSPNTRLIIAVALLELERTLSDAGTHERLAEDYGTHFFDTISWFEGDTHD